MDGRTVLELGAEPGPIVGQALDAALDAVVDGEAPNDHEALRAFLAGWLAEHADKARS